MLCSNELREQIPLHLLQIRRKHSPFRAIHGIVIIFGEPPAGQTTQSLRASQGGCNASPKAYAAGPPDPPVT